MKDLFSEGKVMKIGLGTWQMGLKGWGSDYDYSAVLEEFSYGIKNGINFVDTAEIYGNGESEKLIGNALESLNRKKIYIATKVADYNASTKRIRKSLLNSLKECILIILIYIRFTWSQAYTQIYKNHSKNLKIWLKRD